MRALAALPWGAMLLIAVVPYDAWSAYGGTFAAWQAHRVAAAAVLAVLVLAAALRAMGVAPARAAVMLALPVAGALLWMTSAGVALVVFAVALLAAAIDRHRRYENAALALCVTGAVLLSGAVLPVLQSAHGARAVVAAGTAGAPAVPAGVTLSATPSVVHIVLDGYGAPDTLRDLYGHDAGPFLADLERRGFVVMRNAVAPYSQTLPSMSSVMSGAPVDVSGYAGRARALRADLGHTLRHGPVPAAFEAAGYTFSRAESGYGFVDFPDAVRVIDREGWMTPFEAHLLRPFADLFGPVHNDILRASLAPGTLADLPQPFFHYQHLIAPHPPFSIAADGTDRPSAQHNFMDGSHFTRGREDRRADYVEGYREKAAFTERMLLRQIDALPTGPKIVVIHGDHGPGAHLDHEDPGRTCMAERMRTFVAIYSDVPGLADRLAARAEEPFATVNIYREILGAISDADLPRLPPEPRFLRWSDPSAAVPVAAEDLARGCGALETAAAGAAARG